MLKPAKIFAIVMVIVCVICAGLAAGLTIGLVSIDKNELSLILINGSAEEKRQARAILPIIKDHHWLLVTLFLFNAVANEALPLFLGDLVPRFWSVILATFTVLIFGEIIPSSIFSGANQMMIASSLSGIVYMLMILFYPVARPIGLFLDYWLGKHETTARAPFNAKDLYTLLSLARVEDPRMEGEADPLVRAPVRRPSYGALSRTSSRANSRRNSFRGDPDVETGEDGIMLSDDELGELSEHKAPDLLQSTGKHDANLLDHDVVTIAQGAIVCSKIFVEEITQPSFYTVNADRVVNLEFMEEIGRHGHSRVPVMSSGSLVGYLLAKELLKKISYYVKRMQPEGKKKKGEGGGDNLLVRNLHIYPVQYCKPTLSVLEALNVMQTGKSRVGVVTTDGSAFGEILGFFTLEDVMEHIIQEEIDDETDSNRKIVAKSLFYAAPQPPGGSTGAPYINL